MQRLEIYQSLWAMERRQPGVAERSAEENFRLIAEAGYAGVCIDPAVHEIEAYAALRPLFERHGLKCLMNAFAGSVSELKPLLELAKELRVPVVSVIGTMYPLTVAGAVPIVRGWLDIADNMGVPILFETHRDCITNDMFFTLQLIDAVPEMRLSADLSHYVVGRELRLPLTPFWEGLFTRLLERTDAMNGRIATREQVQVPLGYAQHKPWEDLFRAWWAQGMSSWRRRSRESDTFVFLCELGPPPYAITGADGRELSNRDEEALVLRSWIEEIWAATAPAKPG